MQPSDLFIPWEGVVTDWEEALNNINDLFKLATDKRELAWRGVANASYALHSSIYRRLVAQSDRFPNEEDVLAFEESILGRARTLWRYDHISALELLAHIQHYGGPTRLLDVSLNPFVALWFAVEQRYDSEGRPSEDSDGRLFIFDVTDRQIALDKTWGGRELPWKLPPNGWRTNLPMIWRPPSYNERIPAQNSAFLIGGVPKFGAGSNMKYRKVPGDGTGAETWSADEVRQTTSVTLSMNTLDRKLRHNSKPTFTLRITAAAKQSIRNALENRFGFNPSSIYPDLFGLAQYGANGIP